MAIALTTKLSDFLYQAKDFYDIDRVVCKLYFRYNTNLAQLQTTALANISAVELSVINDIASRTSYLLLSFEYQNATSFITRLDTVINRIRAKFPSGIYFNSSSMLNAFFDDDSMEYDTSIKLLLIVWHAY